MENNETSDTIKLELEKYDFLDMLEVLDYVGVQDVTATFSRKERALRLSRMLREKFLNL